MARTTTSKTGFEVPIIRRETTRDEVREFFIAIDRPAGTNRAASDLPPGLYPDPDL